MPKLDARQETVDAIGRRIADLSDRSLTQLSQYISYLKWQEELWIGLLDQESEPGSQQPLVWEYDFLEAFSTATTVATRSPDMMEVKVATATCGMVQQPALWEHPPVTGSAVCEYQVQIPANVDTLRLRFGIGIRDGALMEGENLCAFRLFVNGARVWSATKQTCDWERFVVDLPSLAGQEIIVQFTTDALGDSRWNWAAWGEPMLLGYGE